MSVESAFEVRESLDEAATRRAAERIRPIDLARLRRLIDRMAVATRDHDVEALVELDRQVHELIYLVAAPTTLPPAVRPLDRIIRPDVGRAFSNQVRAWQIQREHRALLSAIERHDAEGAAAVAVDHIRQAAALRSRTADREPDAADGDAEEPTADG